MKLIASAAAAALAAAIPFAVLAQAAPPPPGGPPPGGGWSQMQKARDDTRAAAFNDIGAAHRAQVQSIVDRVNAGTLTDLRAAAQQIDAILTPDEAKAVLAEHRKLHDAMRARFREQHGMQPGAAGAPPPPGGPPPSYAVPNAAPPAGPEANGAPPPAPGAMGPGAGGPPDRVHEGGPHRGMMNDAGAVLLMLAVSPERMHALHERPAPGGAQNAPRPGTR